MTSIVVVGAGIGGVPAAYSLKAQLGDSGTVTVVSNKPFFHFVPSNPWVGMGWRTFDEIAFPIQPHLEARDILFEPFAATRIEAESNRVVLGNGSVLHYDQLLLATGPEPAFDEIEGLGPEHHTHSVTHIEDAFETYHAYQQFMQNPGPIVIGAAQNASILGPVYEFAFLVDADLRRRGIRDRAPITVVTPEPYPGHLGLGHEGDTERLLAGALQARDISVICNAITDRVDAKQLHISVVDAGGMEKTKHQLPFAFSVYWPAFRGVKALRDSNPELTDERGFVVIDEYLRNPRFPNIFAIGVCASHSRLDKTPVPVGAPTSVYSIQNEVDTVAQNMLAPQRGNDLISNVPRRARWLSDVGEGGARFLSEPQIPLRNINWLKQGKWVHLAKVDFEKYFLNRIKLRPNRSAPGMGSSIATTVCSMQSQHNQGGTQWPAAKGPTKTLPVKLPRDSCYELRAMAGALGYQPEAFAAELLSAAIRDAKACLSAASLDDIERTRRKILLEELPENQPGIEFEGGAP